MVSASQSKNTLPPARELQKEVETLRKELSIVKSEKESMEREYENVSNEKFRHYTPLYLLEARNLYHKGAIN